MIWYFFFYGKQIVACLFQKKNLSQIFEGHTQGQKSSLTTEKPVRTNDVVVKPIFFKGNSDVVYVDMAQNRK